VARVTVDLPEHFPFETEIPIRIGDINYGGHLGNDTVLTLVHESRVRYLKSLGFTELNVGGCGITQADAAVVYRSEAFYGQTVRIQVAARLEGRSSFDLYYRLTDISDGREIAQVKTGIVCFDYTKRKVTRIPDILRDAITQND